MARCMKLMPCKESPTSRRFVIHACISHNFITETRTGYFHIASILYGVKEYKRKWNVRIGELSAVITEQVRSDDNTAELRGRCTASTFAGSQTIMRSIVAFLSSCRKFQVMRNSDTGKDRFIPYPS